ncbi:hypothetical protein M407DRAFT_43689, partial [Tulasnella calospora MUT 4182]
NIRKGRYEIVLTSPEMVLGNAHFQALIASSKFSSHITRVFVDECHCISQWGANFRLAYAYLGRIRSFLPSRIPFTAVSATLPPDVLADIRRNLDIDKTALFINLGNDRPNI